MDWGRFGNLWGMLKGQAGQIEPEQWTIIGALAIATSVVMLLTYVESDRPWPLQRYRKARRGPPGRRGALWTAIWATACLGAGLVLLAVSASLWVACRFQLHELTRSGICG